MRRICSADALRQGRSGPTPIRNRSSRNRGTVVWTKYGPPTVDCRLVRASTTNGKIVPSSTTKVTANRTRLLPRNAASRDNEESKRPSERRRHDCMAMRPNPATRTTTRNPRYIGPTNDCANA